MLLKIILVAETIVILFYGVFESFKIINIKYFNIEKYEKSLNGVIILLLVILLSVFETAYYFDSVDFSRKNNFYRNIPVDMSIGSVSNIKEVIEYSFKYIDTNFRGKLKDLRLTECRANLKNKYEVSYGKGTVILRFSAENINKGIIGLPSIYAEIEVDMQKEMIEYFVLRGIIGNSNYSSTKGKDKIENIVEKEKSIEVEKIDYNSWNVDIKDAYELAKKSYKDKVNNGFINIIMNSDYWKLISDDNVIKIDPVNAKIIDYEGD